MTEQTSMDFTPGAEAERAAIPRTAYSRLADYLSREAESNAEVHTYLSADDVARALGDSGYDERGGYGELRTWIEERRSLGREPTVDEIVAWTEEQE